MPGIRDVGNLWENVREIDLRPLKEEALRGVKIAIVGRPGTGRHILAAEMRRDPARPGTEAHTPLLILDLDEVQANAEQLEAADLTVLTLDALSADDRAERNLARTWGEAGKRVVVVITRLGTELAAAGDGTDRANRTFGVSLDNWPDWDRRQVIVGRVDDKNFLIREFIPAVIELLPDRTMALGRHFPLFRVTIARHLINETCISNATYALSTGLAEVVPVLNLPLNVADMIVLTKSQAFLVYKLGLALGMSTRWQDYVTEFGGVLGGGFVWRQMARSLIGLIPAWGIIPKVAVAYSGTYVVGHGVLQWYLTGRHIDREQMRQLTAEAFTVGKNVARSLRGRLHRPRLSLRRRAPRSLPGPKAPALGPGTELGQPELEAGSSPGSPAQLPPTEARLPRDCQACGRTNAPDAHFCQYCGASLQGG